MPLRRFVAVAFGPLALAAGALAVAPSALAQPTPLFQGVTYERSVEFTAHGPVVLHVARGPKPVGLYRLRPILSNEAVLGRETVSSMERRLAGQATMVGVNGDFSRFSDGHPSGILLRDGILVTPPHPGRSSAGIGLDGILDIRRVKFVATWRGTGQRRPLSFLNESPGPNGITLFTPEWGPATPRIPGSFAVVLGALPGATPNADLTAPVVSSAADGPVRIDPGNAVLVARGTTAAKLQAEAAIGTRVTVRLILQPQWPTVADAIGGGPVLVRNGAPVYRSNEAFTPNQLAPRGPRTAIGQRANGELLLVTTDGRQPGYSVGMTNFELALAMVRLGAVRAMALDSGGSSTIAFDGKVLNSPSDGKERPIGTALMLQYFGVYSPPPLEAVVSPNGDGIAEAQKLSYKVVRPSNVTVTLTAPDGSIASQETSARQPGLFDVPFPPAPAPVEGQPPPQPEAPAEGRWTLSVASTDDQGLGSSTTQRFSVNSTLGFLKVTPNRLVLRRGTGGKTTIRWIQSRPARVKVTVETLQGIVLQTVASSATAAGSPSVSWNGQGKNGKPLAAGRYVVRVAATNELGVVSLAQPVLVRRSG